MENFKMVEVKDAPRVELHNQLGLTGCEISINELPPKAAVPFVHAHKQNEEVYGVLAARAKLYIDGQVVDIKAGDWFVIRPTDIAPFMHLKMKAFNSFASRQRAEACRNLPPETPSFLKKKLLG